MQTKYILALLKSNTTLRRHGPTMLCRFLFGDDPRLETAFLHLQLQSISGCQTYLESLQSSASHGHSPTRELIVVFIQTRPPEILRPLLHHMIPTTLPPPKSTCTKAFAIHLHSQPVPSRPQGRLGARSKPLPTLASRERGR